MRMCMLWGTTWERPYQKAITESIHLAHLRVGRSRQLYGQKSQCSESARQLRFPCSQPAIHPVPRSYQRQTLPRDPQSHELHWLLLSQSMAFTRVHTRVGTQTTASGAKDFTAEAGRLLLRESNMYSRHCSGGRHLIPLHEHDIRIWAFDSILVHHFTQEAPTSP